MTDTRIRRILILGGGVAAWMAALALSKITREQGSVCVVDAPDAARESALLECGESCLPTLKAMHRSLGIDERAFMRETGATFKLGTRFQGWNGSHTYFNPFGDFGASLEGVAFHHHWLRVFQEPEDLSQFSLNAVAARLGRFVHPSPDPRSVLSTLDYAYQFDAERYLALLRSLAQQQGVRRIPDRLKDVKLREVDGFIETVTLERGEHIEADLFIDCSGNEGALIQEVLNTGYEDWTHWLPCDRMIAVHCENSGDPNPYTDISAHGAGWQWRIPLQYRTSSGYVYCSTFMSEEEAASSLLATLDGSAAAQPRSLRFTSGRRKKFWNKNCIALGLAAGYLEPLESTNLHLIQSGISKLAGLFPHKGRMLWESEEYNRLLGEEYERVRDMLIAHYSTASPPAAPFWDSLKSAELPEPLQHKLRVFRSRGRVVLYDEETFNESHWAGVLLGQGVRPAHPDALAQTLPLERVTEQLQRMKSAIAQAAQGMPSQAKIIKHHCAAEAPRRDAGSTSA